MPAHRQRRVAPVSVDVGRRAPPERAARSLGRDMREPPDRSTPHAALEVLAQPTRTGSGTALPAPPRGRAPPRWVSNSSYRFFVVPASGAAAWRTGWAARSESSNVRAGRRTGRGFRSGWGPADSNTRSAGFWRLHSAHMALPLSRFPEQRQRPQQREHFRQAQHVRVQVQHLRNHGRTAAAGRQNQHRGNLLHVPFSLGRPMLGTPTPPAPARRRR